MPNHVPSDTPVRDVRGVRLHERTGASSGAMDFGRVGQVTVGCSSLTTGRVDAGTVVSRYSSLTGVVLPARDDFEMSEVPDPSPGRGAGTRSGSRTPPVGNRRYAIPGRSPPSSVADSGSSRRSLSGSRWTQPATHHNGRSPRGESADRLVTLEELCRDCGGVTSRSITPEVNSEDDPSDAEGSE